MSKKKALFLTISMSTVLLVLLIPPNISFRPTESTPSNVLIVVIDGARYSEQFGSGDTYIPHMWNDLRPLGSINHNFWNEGQLVTMTTTTPGHANILTGTWQMIKNGRWIKKSPDWVPNHPTMPTLWEYVRKEWDLEPESCFIVSNKYGNVIPLQFSNHPEYGKPYGANFTSLRTEGYNKGPEADYDVYDILVGAMDTYHPRFVLVNLGPDDMGHGGWKEEYGGDGVPLSEAHWNVYTQTLGNVDEVVWMIWNKIQSDEFYEDKTMMIVTNDHGRHSDGVAGEWKGHKHGTLSKYSEECEGCQHLMFLAIGPCVKKGFSTYRYRTQIDILSTIAEIMGFHTPYSYGHIMWEIIN